ncbi:hypothetical protein GX51_06544 [Blastomyces parvus]|uniref:Protein kinase domain-containing protein n=1 Tax=Blastomyces parvus TaxID=2060905 RepID=A0A2B7WQX2_9EURO|nr:hypothetical protein GX51_06544 [Blastomyces parvus]
MSTESDKRATMLDFKALKVRYSSPSESTSSAGRPDELHQSQRDLQSKSTSKRKAPPAQERTGKLMKGTQRSLGLPQIVESGVQSLIVRNESPWDTFLKVFNCKLAGTVTIAVHRTRPSRVVAIREYPMEDAERMLQRFRQVQHQNIISARECYSDKEAMYALVDDLPLTLVQLVGCRAYPSESQLASIIGQVLDGLSYLITAGFEHKSLTCSNILLGLDGSVKIAGLEFCVERLPNQTQIESIKALATITMELMQKYDKDDGLIGVDDLDRWPVDSASFGFLSATSSAMSIEVLKEHPLVSKQRPSPGVLVGLARLALISARTFYSCGS